MRSFMAVLVAAQTLCCCGLYAQPDATQFHEEGSMATAGFESRDAPAEDMMLTAEGHPRASASITAKVRERVRAWFAVIESELETVDYGKPLHCAPERIPYINLVVHIQHGKWRAVCGSMNGPRGAPLAEVLNKIVPTIPALDVMIPFGMHDGVEKRKESKQRIPVLGSVYHKRYSQVSLPFAMGSVLAPSGYVNTPVVGWDGYARTWYSCKNKSADIKKAVFRGKAKHHAQKYGSCTNACSWKDNGRLYVHSLGQEYPLLFDSAASNAQEFRMPQLTPKQRVDESSVKKPIPFPDQLCNYYAVLNIGNKMDWTDRLRQSFYGNAVIMMPEDPPHEFFSSFMEPYVHYWPLKPDLSDTIHQVKQVLGLENLTEQVEGQRAFAAKFLSEKFMIFYNKVVIEEYDRRVRSFNDQTWKAPSTEEVERAKSLLRLRGCEEKQFRERACSAVK